MIIFLLLALGIQPTPYKDWQNEALYGSGESGTYVKQYNPPKYKSKKSKQYVRVRIKKEKSWLETVFEPKS